MPEELKCQNCGKGFIPTCHITRQKFCSDACRNRYHSAKGHYPPSPPATEHSREWAVKGRNARRLRRLALDGPPRLCHPSRRGGGYILQSRPLSHEWERAGG